MPRPRQSRTDPEALAALRERLRATQEAARTLADEALGDAAAREPGGDSDVPPRGWDVPGRADDANAELEALLRLVATLRDLVPPELRAQLAQLVRQLLVFVRAVLDWWIERIEGGPRGSEREVEDIPIA